MKTRGSEGPVETRSTARCRQLAGGLSAVHKPTPGPSTCTIAVKPNSEFRLNGVYGILRLSLFAANYHWDFHTGVNSIQDRGDGACH